ncbi:hypothetical protein LSAT2_017799 [Lamellibrachia satsuma]|nr:hypothetical protein LSAT2_017799 [Lamellibrachia satsuma]
MAYNNDIFESNLRARTIEARAKDGSDVNATIVGAVAAKYRSSDRIHVELTEDRTGLVIFVDYENQTLWHKEIDVGAEKSFDGFILSKERKSSLTAAFPNGIVLTVAANERRLDLSLLVPVELQGPHTRGLFGIFDGVPDNDLTPLRKDGNNGIPLRMSGVSERNIFDNFADTWRTKWYERLFHYHSGTSHFTFNKPSFRPTFSDDFLGGHLSSLTAEQTAKYTSTCGQSNQCIFDLALTNDVPFAASTLEQIRRNEKTQSVLANGSPTLEVNVSEVNATVGIPIAFVVQVWEDGDLDEVEVRNVSALPVGSTLNSSSGLFTWTPRNKDVVALCFVAVDKHGSMSAEDTVNIKMCGCSEHGKCLYDQLAYGQYRSSAFRLVACQCDIGWTGEFCDDNFDGCADTPCMMGTTCTDVHPVEHAQTGKAFFCSMCPKGYEKNYGICVDVNECQHVKMNNCSQRCQNVPKAAFSCGCRAGYRLAADGATCNDINECTDRTSQCEHICHNLVGSYRCSCHGGYALEKDGHACSSSSGNHCDGVTCRNGGTCQVYIGDYKCICAVGFTGTNCETEASPCSSSPCIDGATCQGDSTSYTCLCPRGYFGSRCEYGKQAQYNILKRAQYNILKRAQHNILKRAQYNILKRAQYNILKRAQYNILKRAQYNILKRAQYNILKRAQYNILKRAQHNILKRAQYNILKRAQYNILKRAQYNILKRAQYNILKRAQYNILKRAQYNILKRAQHNILKRAQYNILKRAQYNILKRAQHNILKRAQYNILKRAQHNILKRAQHNILKRAQYNILKRAQHNILKRAQYDILKRAQYNILKQAQHNILKRAQYDILKRAQYNILKQAQYNILKRAQYNILKQAQYNILKRAQYDILKRAQYNILKQAQYNILKQAQYNILKRAQYNILKRAQYNILKPRIFIVWIHN